MALVAEARRGLSGFRIDKENEILVAENQPHDFAVSPA
jgi:hypothetical protein